MRGRTKARRSNRQKSKLGLPDLEHVKSAVLMSLRSPESQRSYRRSIEDFVCWYCSEPRLSQRDQLERRARRAVQTLRYAVEIPPVTWATNYFSVTMNPRLKSSRLAVRGVLKETDQSFKVRSAEILCRKL